MRRAWVSLLLLVLAACEPCAAQPASAPTASADDAGNRILVMLGLPPEHFRADAGYGGQYVDDPGRRARRRFADALASRRKLSVVDDWPMPLLGIDCFVMTAPDRRAAADAAAEIARDPLVVWAQPMNVFTARRAGDPLYPVQPAAQDWRLSDLHEVATGRNVRVAVVDSGVDRLHPDLVGRVAVSEDFVGATEPVAESHGTGVAGVIAALDGNGIGIAGVAPGTILLALRACREAPVGVTRCSTLSLAKAVYFAITHDADILNLSLGGPYDPLLARLLDVASARGVTVVAAVDRGDPSGGFPASHPGVVAVADDAPGPLPPGALKAPGRDVPTTAPGGRWAIVSGSSYAAAHVSGLLALVREIAPSVDGPAAGSALAVRAAGEVDACATVSRVGGACACACVAARAAAPR